MKDDLDMVLSFIRNILVLSVFSVSMIGASFSYASDLSIAVVDVQLLLTKSKAAQSIQKQVKAEREKFLSKITKQEEVLRSMEKDLIEKGKDMSAEERAEKKKDFEAKFVSTQKAAQQGKGKIEKAVMEAMAKLNKAAFEAVESIASDKGYNLILAKQQVVASDKSIDISQESLKKLDGTVSKIDVKF